MLTTCDGCGCLCNYNSDHPDLCDECYAELRYEDEQDAVDAALWDEFDDIFGTED